MSARVIPYVVSVDELLALQRAGGDVRLVDVRWRLGKPEAGPAAYATGHLPGALFADIDKDLAAPPGAHGRHPLPSKEAFEALMKRLGIGDRTLVVAYDDQGGATAARLWFLLRYFGHETGAVLDGGIDAFVKEGHALDTSVAPSRVVSFTATPHPELLLAREAVVAGLRDPARLLLDARAGERYRGEVEPIDPRAGHIPGAVSAPYAENLAKGELLSADALAARYRALGADDCETVVYCGSGVTACHDLLALAVAGYDDAKLYPGSWSEWSSDPDAPIATGA
jgi:thiosulfate/3-mercaptopyruvate sulfurtransferase